MTKVLTWGRHQFPDQLQVQEALVAAWLRVPKAGKALDSLSVDILARSAEDLALALDVVSGPEPLVESGWKLELPPPRHAKLSDYRVALWPSDPIAPVAGEVADCVQQLGDRLAALGATVSDSARPAFEVARSHETYLYLLNGVMAAGLPEEVLDAMEAQVSALDPADQSDNAVMARAAVQKHGEWLRHNNRREALRMAWRDFFQDWDILLCPQTATPAFEHDHRPIPERTLAVDDAMQPYFQQLFWAGLITVAYLPSTVFPTGLSGDGLPIGLQAVSAEYADRTCIDFARLMADEIGGFVPPPGY